MLHPKRKPRVLPPSERWRPPLAPPAQSLQEACRQAGLDRGGARCPECRLLQLCLDETRWVISRRVPAAARARCH